MNAEAVPQARTVPPEAQDAAGGLLGPERISLEALIDPTEVSLFAESVAELTQVEC